MANVDANNIVKNQKDTLTFAKFMIAQIEMAYQGFKTANNITKNTLKRKLWKAGKALFLRLTKEIMGNPIEPYSWWRL